MLFKTPELQEAELRVLDQLRELRENMRIYLHEPRRWHGPLRRQAFARAIQGSNTIEGYSAELDDAAAIALGQDTLDADEETRLALKGYREAMTFVLQLADDPDFTYGGQLIRSLHFMMMSYDLSKRPGRWRSGAVFVHTAETGEIVYEGAPAEDVVDLMTELLDRLNEDDDLPAIVRAAMVHLNLVLVHPFSDGNGRMARCLQSLVLSREGILSPVFVNIEEYLGRNTQAYYHVLTEIGGGSWQPTRDARPWLRFVLTAHLRQARTWFQRIKDTERLWGELETLISHHGLRERSIVALYDAAMRFRVRNATYRAALDEMDEALSDQSASRDLRALVDAGLLVKKGRKRGTYYVASPSLTAIRQSIVKKRGPRDDSDPFAEPAP
jgi:Fic family protein